ncbi:MAG: RNA recognition motif domain-containing protein [Succinivibrionaceae bacterium]
MPSTLNYIASCFISILFSLLYLLIFTKFSGTAVLPLANNYFLIITCIYILFVGIITPLTFKYSNKITTNYKEDARPHMTDKSDIIEECAKNESSKTKKSFIKNILEQNQTLSKPILINDEEYITLYLGNIPFKMNENDITELLKQFGGKINSIYISKDFVTKRKKGIAFVQITKTAGLNAIKQLEGAIIMGRTIVIKIANERKMKE